MFQKSGMLAQLWRTLRRMGLRGWLCALALVLALYQRLRRSLAHKRREWRAQTDRHVEARAQATGKGTGTTGTGTDTPLPSICFQGAGCVLVYHVGVARYVCAHFETEHARFLGASGGAVVAACVAAGVDLEFVLQRGLAVAEVCREPPLGPFFRLLPEVEAAFVKALHEQVPDGQVPARCNGRLFLSLTHLPTMGQRLLSDFPSREELAVACTCSMNLPVFLCPLKRVEGELYVDGGLSDNAPAWDAGTVTVSPCDASAHVHPPAGKRPSLLRFVIPGDRDFMLAMQQQGWDDAAANHDLFVRQGWRPRKRQRAQRDDEPPAGISD